jgi:hypothetical protein
MYNVFGSLTGHCKFDGRRVREIVEGSGFVEMYLFDGELIGRCGKETQLLRNYKFPIGFTQIRHFLFFFFTGSSWCAKIVKADGTNLTDKEKTGIINLPLQTM